MAKCADAAKGTDQTLIFTSMTQRDKNYIVDKFSKHELTLKIWKCMLYIHYILNLSCGTSFVLCAQPLSHRTQGWLISPKTPMHAPWFIVFVVVAVAAAAAAVSGGGGVVWSLSLSLSDKSRGWWRWW